MKKWVIISATLIVILTVAAVIYFLQYNYYRCSIKYKSGCNIDCIKDSDCKISACSCVNKNEKVYVPLGMALYCPFVKNCACIENKCKNQ